MKRWICLLGLGMAATASQAQEVYGGLGLPGAMLGYAHHLSPSLTLRGDISTLGSRSANGTEEGIDYNGTLKTRRLGVFADWFVFGGGFRLTGGFTSNKFGVDLAAQPAVGQSITIGNSTYVSTGADRFDVSIKFPSNTPYFGIGYGHQQGKGLGFVMDLGASIGTAKVSAVASGPVLGAAGVQTEVDREIAQLRDGVGKMKFLPQLSLALSYKF